MKSFFQGRKTLEISALRPPAGFASPHAPKGESGRGPGSGGGHAHGAASAHVEVVKEGDKVVRLVVTCVCGERVEVECLYAAGS